MNWKGFENTMKCVGPVFFLAVVIFLIVSCTRVVAREIKEEEKAYDGWPASKMRYVEFDGHQYVLLEKLGTKSGGITHSPKCKCPQKEEHNDTER